MAYPSQTFDLVFIDADKPNYISYWEASLPKLRRGGLIVADNVLWSGSVLKPEDESDHAIVNFNRHAAASTARTSSSLCGETIRSALTCSNSRLSTGEYQ